MKPLFEVAAVTERLLETEIDEETGEMSPLLIHALAQLKEGGRAVAAYCLNTRAEADAVGGAIKRLQARKKALERRDEHLRAYLAEQMARTATTRIDASDGSFVVRRYPDRDEHVEIDPDVVLPEGLTRTKVVVEPDKVAIKAAIEAGEPVPAGVRLVKTDRLVIG